MTDIISTFHNIVTTVFTLRNLLNQGFECRIRWGFTSWPG